LGPDHKVNQSKPEISEESIGWYQAFQHLTYTRPAGMDGALPILLTEIEAYCRIMEIAIEERAGFVRIIRRIDLQWLEMLHNRKTKTITQPGA
jgi:hypothetical protein